MGIGSILSTAINNKMGVKFCLMLGGAGNIVWILTTVLAAKYKEAKESQPDSVFASYRFIVCLIFLSSIVNGFTVGILWSSANSFISSCANDQNKGFFFSYYWSFYMASQIFGNLIAAIVLKEFKQQYFFEIMAFLAFVATISFLFIQQPKKTIKRATSGRLKLDQSMSVESRSFYSDIKSVIQLLFSKRMRLLLPQLCWTGISISVYSGMLVPIIVDTLQHESESEQFELSMLAMVSLGFGEIFGSLIIGQVIDRIGSKRTSLINAVLILVADIVVLCFMLRRKYGPIAFVMTFLWGFQDSSVSIHLNTILGFEFEAEKEPFSIDSLMEAFMVFSFQLI